MDRQIAIALVRRHLSSVTLALSGVIMMGIGAYFVLFRPPLLPEDLRYMNTSAERINSIEPGLAQWLQYVFRVAGGYMATSGLLITYLAGTSFRTGGKIVTIVVAFAGLLSIGQMTMVNFLIDSDFKWFLVPVSVLWTIAIAAKMETKRIKMQGGGSRRSRNIRT